VINLLREIPKDNPYRPHFFKAMICLTRIPKNETSRKLGFQLVTAWITANQ